MSFASSFKHGLAVICLALSASQAHAALYPDAERFRSAIDAFQTEHAQNPVPEGAIIATGSSSMRGWHGRIIDDLSPLPVIPRGFGGSNMYDVRYFLKELVLQYKPRAVMIYEGDNDAALGASTEQVMLHFAAIVDELHIKLPSTRIYVFAVKPSISRWEIWPTMAETNRQLKAFSEADPLVTYVDVASPMLGDDGKPIKSIFLDDMLHMNGEGYDIWRDAVRPVLLKGEGRGE
jgi:lysophospholipase L1-like esterase